MIFAIPVQCSTKWANKFKILIHIQFPLLSILLNSKIVQMDAIFTQRKRAKNADIRK